MAHIDVESKKRKIPMKKLIHLLPLALVGLLVPVSMMLAQAPGGGKGGPGGAKAAPRPVLSVTSPAWPDGGEVPMRNAGRGENKSPEFEFHWTLAAQPTATPDGLQTYAV